MSQSVGASTPLPPLPAIPGFPAPKLIWGQTHRLGKRNLGQVLEQVDLRAGMCCTEAGFIEPGATGNLNRGQPLLQVTNRALKQKLNAAERPEDQWPGRQV